MRVIERPFSDLLRHPNEVAGDLEQGDVLLRRRDQPDLRLSRADREAERAVAFVAFGRTLRNLAVRNRTALDEALVDAFPWVDILPKSDRREFADEFSRVAIAAADLDSYGPLSQLIHEWRATAEIHADPSLVRRLRRPLPAAGEPIAIPLA